jgi:methylthioribose-1-phosphate isomerase
MRTIEWDDEKEAVKLIDQTLLPGEYTIVDCKTLEELIDAIRRLKVRGAPA